MFDEIVLATGGNGGKRKRIRPLVRQPEASACCRKLNSTCPNARAGMPTFIENAIAKARHAAKHSAAAGTGR